MSVSARPMDDDLKSLVRKVAAGDRGAFAMLYGRTAPKLVGIALRITRSRELAEDVVQETFVRVWNGASRYDEKVAAPLTWMATIARNQAIDMKRRGAEKLSAQAVEIDDTNLAALGTTSDEAVVGDDMRRLQQCLEQLPADRREMVVLAYYTGSSREELSVKFNRPVATVKTLLHRSLAVLKDCMNG